MGRLREGGPTIPDNPNWRRHRDACIHYREHWPPEGERAEDGLPLLYQAICLRNTPPVTTEEQEKCMQARTFCWRILEAARTAAASHVGAERGAPARQGQRPLTAAVGSTTSALG